MKKYMIRSIPQAVIKLCIVIVSILATLGFLEILLRYYYYRWNNNYPMPFLINQRSFPKSEDIGSFLQSSQKPGVLTEFQPNLKETFYDLPFYTNSAGMIGTDEYIQQKPKDIIRIIGIGDSVMTSWGVTYDQTYLKILEHALNASASGKRVEVLNMAVPGYNLAIESEVIKQKALVYQPDFIIIGYVGNDMNLPNTIRVAVHAKSYVWYVIKRTVQLLTNMNQTKSIVYDISSFFNYLLNYHSSKSPRVNGRIAYDPKDVPQEYQYMVGSQNYLRLMQQLADNTIRKGIPVTVLASDRIIDEGQERISQYFVDLQNMGFDTIDLDNEMDILLQNEHMTWDDIHLSKDDPHLNVLGHTLVAEVLQNYFSKKILK